MRRLFPLLIAACVTLYAQAQSIIHIEDPETWFYSDIPASYIGQTVTFDKPFYICNNYYHQRNEYTIAPRRLFSPTNQELPGSAAYTALTIANNGASVTLKGLEGYHRMGELITSLTVKIESKSVWSVVATPTFYGNTREEVEANLPNIDLNGEHSLLVCSFNLEYYLVENLGNGTMGPTSPTMQNRQHTKISEAICKIGADIFGFVEIEQGQKALEKLANTLTQCTGRTYRYINDGSRASGTYTKAGYVYCTETVEPVGGLMNNNSGVSNRKKIQAFKEKSSGQVFLFSLNHFKAKSGSGSGSDADQGDGQGTFNGSRIAEAESVLSKYIEYRERYYNDDDILIMGDLNAYGMEDPITVLKSGGMTDLHRYFHQDSSYSYIYHGQAGYLDHALCNRTMLNQITGMAAWHINSDEDDRFTYGGQLSDLTMFRCSDHDPVLVGLHLIPPPPVTEDYTQCKPYTIGGNIIIPYAQNGYFKLFNSNGLLLQEGNILDAQYNIDYKPEQGFYILNIYVEGRILQVKLLVP